MPPRPVPVTAAAEQRRLNKYRRYNASSKGQARDLRYEARHPERRVRWSPITGRDVARLGPLAHPFPTDPQEDESPC